MKSRIILAIGLSSILSMNVNADNKFYIQYKNNVSTEQIEKDEQCLIGLSSDNSKTVYRLADIQKITINQPTADDNKGYDAILFAKGETITLSDEAKDTKVFTYPNPVSEKLYVSGVASGEELMIYGVDGKVIKTSKTSENVTEINVSNLSNGQYLLRCGKSVVKFIKK